MKTIKIEMLLGYSLLNRYKISYKELFIIKEKIEQQLNDIYVNLSHTELYHAVENYPLRFEIKVINNELYVYIIKRFERSFLDNCFESFFSNKEFSIIRKVIENG